MSAVSDNDIFGFIRPAVDAHTLGIAVISGLLADCGYKVHIGTAGIAQALDKIQKIDNISLLGRWIIRHNITRLGFSYRLDPGDAQLAFGKVYHLLREYKLFHDQGGSLLQIYFAGLPDACAVISSEYSGRIPVFVGDETPLETLKKIGIPDSRIPKIVYEGSAYDSERLAFATDLVGTGKYHLQRAPARGGYPEFGTFRDSLVARVRYNNVYGSTPLIRAHVGPYSHDYAEARKEFRSWLEKLSATGFLDIVSVGSSQLSQSDFGKEWGDKPNGGGVPLNSEQDLRDVWEASRPMLVRTYAGTRNIVQLAEIYEKTINIAWHALSLWWFNQIDGRGPNSVRQNLAEHIDTLKYIAATGKPFEPNIPHHFSFRGGDDYTYVLSAYLAAILAKRMGVRYLVLQVMLNTPKYTWGIQDLAKARALLFLVRTLEDKSFRVFLQPRAGLDYFSPDIEKAKIQLAAVTAMMDDIDPYSSQSPDIIHVVSYSEAVRLATPEVINESIQITLNTLIEYRREKSLGNMDDMKNHADLKERTLDLVNEVQAMTALLGKKISNIYSAEGLYTILQKGVMPLPYLWEGRDEFREAVKWKTAIVNGGVRVVDDMGLPVRPIKRLQAIFED